MGISAYELVLTLHIVGVVGWVGTLLAFDVVGTRVRARADHAQAVTFAADHALLTRAVAVPGALVVLLTGGWLMRESDLQLGRDWWLGTGIGAWIVAFLGSTMLRGPALARVVRLAAEHGPDDEDVRWRLRQVLLIARGELLLLVVALVVMVLTPTA